MELSLAVAFAAGVVSFASPCVLALVPVYLAFLAEVAAGSPAGTASRRSVLVQAVLFSLGFSAVFITLGVSAGLLGVRLFAGPGVRQIVGIAVIVLGFLMTGAAGPVLDRFRPPISPSAPASGRSGRAFLLGALVAVGWTPCIGPVLGAILAMGASAQDAPAATLLMVAYSAGLALPFLVAAVALPRIQPLLEWLRRHHRSIAVVSGIAVMAVGVLILFDAFTWLSGLFSGLWL
jgi:cytochrome c-type biogenesis protein